MAALFGDLDVLAIVGITLFVAYIFGQIFRIAGIPQVVGFIVAGVALGPSVLQVIPAEFTDSLVFVTELALGLIGFEMGEHLRFDDLRAQGKSILMIVLLQAAGAFVLVAIGVYLLTGSTPAALLLGAISMATAPAATVDVLAEYDAEGPLTTTLLAVIGIDDALTLLVFSFAAVLAEPMIASTGPTLSAVDALRLPIVEIGGSLLIGIAFGLMLGAVMNVIGERHDPEHRQHDAMAVLVAVVFMATGLSHTIDLSLILATMVMGVVVVNRNPRNGHYIRFTIEQAGPVIYVLFFVLVGAGLRISALPAIGLVGIAYLLLRIIGKYTGAWLGGWLAGTPPIVRDNLGLALLSQAGVAIGLSLEVSHRFGELGPEGEDLHLLVVDVVTASTFIVQLIGPVLVKVAIRRAGEIGKVAGVWHSETDLQ